MSSGILLGCCCATYKLNNCDSSEIIYTATNMAAYVGRVVKLSHGDCYYVSEEAGSPLQPVSVQNDYDDCDACGAAPNPCSNCQEATMPLANEMQLAVSGITLCTCCESLGTPSRDLSFSGDPNATVTLDTSSLCVLSYTTTDRPITVAAHLDAGTACAGSVDEIRHYRVKYWVFFFPTYVSYVVTLEDPTAGSSFDLSESPLFCKREAVSAPINCGVNRAQVSNYLTSGDCCATGTVGDCGAGTLRVVGYGGTAILTRA